MALNPELLLLELSKDLGDAKRRLELLEQLKLAENLGQLKEELKAITAYLQALAAQDEEDEEPERLNPAVVPDWRTLTADQAGDWWEVLVHWCREVLYPTYAYIAHVWRPCWYKHPQVVEELTWLCAYWHWAYQSKGAPPSRASDWHTRAWPHVRQQLEVLFERCFVPEGSLSTGRPAHRQPSEQDPTVGLTPEQRHQLAEWEAASRARMEAARARSGQALDQVKVNVAPRHALQRGHDRDFADDEDLGQFILADIAERRAREETPEVVVTVAD
jgi:hypothetical protein